MLLLIGIVIGLVLGLTGAGGSVFAVPLLILLGGLPISDAIGMSLGAVAVSTLYGSLRNLRNNTILWLPVSILAGAGSLAAPIGKWLGAQLPQSWLIIAFNVLALVIATRMLINAKRNPEATKIVRSALLSEPQNAKLLCNLSTHGQFELRPRCISGLAVGGLVTGLLSGLFGVGGGFLIVPLLLFLSQISMTQAVSSSLVIITLVSSAGFITHLSLNAHSGAAMPWALLGWVAFGAVLGMLGGQWLCRFIAGPRLQQLSALSLIAVSLVTFFLHH